MRPVLIPGNVIKGEWRVRVSGQLASLVAEPLHSRAHLLSEPLATLEGEQLALPPAGKADVASTVW